MPAIPELTPEQRLAARERALAARRIRAQVKEELRCAPESLEAVLARARGDEAVARLRVIEVLQALPGVGAVRAEAIMGRLGIAVSRRLRGLGPRQAEALLEEFGHRG